MSRKLAALTAVAYVACVVLANVLTEHFGLVPVGFGLMVTAGTFAAGATLLARNITQDYTGRMIVVGLMLVGCGVSWWLASPELAVASATAFALSETTDMLIYSPLRGRGFGRAVAAAAVASSIVDTLVFLSIAGFPITASTVTGQLVVKIGISWLVAAAAGVSGVVLREPI